MATPVGEAPHGPTLLLPADRIRGRRSARQPPPISIPTLLSERFIPEWTRNMCTRQLLPSAGRTARRSHSPRVQEVQGRGGSTAELLDFWFKIDSKAEGNATLITRVSASGNSLVADRIITDVELQSGHHRVRIQRATNWQVARHSFRHVLRHAAAMAAVGLHGNGRLRRLPHGHAGLSRGLRVHAQSAQNFPTPSGFVRYWRCRAGFRGFSRSCARRSCGGLPESPPHFHSEVQHRPPPLRARCPGAESSPVMVNPCHRAPEIRARGG